MARQASSTNARLRRTEAALRTSEAVYAQMFDSNPHPMWVFDVESLQILAVNNAAVALYGYSHDEFLAMTIRDMRPADELPRLMQRLADVETGYRDTGTWRHLRKNGSVIEVEVSWHTLHFNGHRAVVALAHDMTEHTLALRALREEEAKFRALSEQSLVGIFITDEHGVIYVNPRAEQILGYGADEANGQHPSTFIAEQDQPRILEELRQLMAGDVASLREEFHARRKDGSEIRVGTHARGAFVGGRRAVIGIIQDITERVRAEETIRDQLARLERALTGTIGAVSRMVELRDPYTAGHDQRVGEIAAAIAGAMGLDENAQHGLRVAGALHDVGKITVPAEILSKPSRLTIAEFELVKAHADQSYDVLRGIEFPWPVAEVARQHHERMDGSGYPRGLKGEEILIEARITAVADVIESMASHRPYRPGLGLPKALAEIELNAGRLYDPAAAAACLELFRERRYMLPV